MSLITDFRKFLWVGVVKLYTQYLRKFYKMNIGKNATIFSRVVIRDWCNVDENAKIGIEAVLVKDIPI